MINWWWLGSCNWRSSGQLRPLQCGWRSQGSHLRQVTKTPFWHLAKIKMIYLQVCWRQEGSGGGGHSFHDPMGPEADHLWHPGQVWSHIMCTERLSLILTIAYSRTTKNSCWLSRPKNVPAITGSKDLQNVNITLRILFRCVGQNCH